MDNMEVYNKVRSAPPEALKPITAGRLKGKSDINPMWRIKALTEVFGMAGVGWYYTIDRQWIEGVGDEKCAFCNISLYVKADGEWSKPIQGIGGSMLAAKEKNGIYASDECFKMALTDAISIACKALGVAADVYWNSDRTKYSMKQEEPQPKAQQAPPPPPPQQQRQQPPQQPTAPRITEQQYQGLSKSLDKAGADPIAVCKMFAVLDLHELDTQQLDVIRSNFNDVVHQAKQLMGGTQ